jgi:hypothetical protein
MARKNTFELLQKLPRQEFPRELLVELLKKEGYAYPKDRISALLREEALLRVAKNWYVLGPKYQRRSLHLRWLSNVMYPSCLSLEYALWYYDMIPEHPEAFTAVSPLRDFSCSCFSRRWKAWMLRRPKKTYVPFFRGPRRPHVFGARIFFVPL